VGQGESADFVEDGAREAAASGVEQVLGGEAGAGEKVPGEVAAAEAEIPGRVAQDVDQLQRLAQAHAAFEEGGLGQRAQRREMGGGEAGPVVADAACGGPAVLVEVGEGVECDHAAGVLGGEARQVPFHAGEEGIEHPAGEVRVEGLEAAQGGEAFVEAGEEGALGRVRGAVATGQCFVDAGGGGRGGSGVMQGVAHGGKELEPLRGRDGAGVGDRVGGSRDEVGAGESGTEPGGEDSEAQVERARGAGEERVEREIGKGAQPHGPLIAPWRIAARFAAAGWRENVQTRTGRDSPAGGPMAWGRWFR
jgi:hypothetical protein